MNFCQEQIRKNILLCTLGASWAVVPEVYGFVNHRQLPLYRNHPNTDQLNALREEYQLQPVDEIWICTTQGQATENSLMQLKNWQHLLPQPPVFRIWQAQGTNELACQLECQHIQELIMRATLLAHHHAQGGQVLLSLAGGRKTMSADMQWAASIFGCQALLHVISADFQKMPEPMTQADPALFSTALSAQNCAAVMPLVSGQTRRSDLLDIEMDGTGVVNTENFPLPLPQNRDIHAWPQPEIWLQTEIKKREKAGSRLLGNYFLDLSRNESHENWRSLYRLSPGIIEKLRNTPLANQHKALLQKLPKADLHRHIGGCLDLPAQRQVAQAIWASLTDAQQTSALQQVTPLLQQKQQPWPDDWAHNIKNNPARSHLAAAILQHASDTQLQTNLWGVTEPRIALKQSRQGFSWYELPGELSGSTVLGNDAALQPYAQHLVKQAVDDGLRYVELRGSPQKYGDGLHFIERFYQAMQEALTSLPERTRPLFRFIIIADRREQQQNKAAQIQATIALAVKAKQKWPDFIVGLDMAGDESKTLPAEIQHKFMPAFEACLPITIHAGEGESAESIWQAAYTLHADRIGHGLTLHSNPPLAERFRNRSICLELCPTSNLEVVGYRVEGQPHTASYKQYPLLELWQKGLPLTVCSDNPGISRTTLTNEYLQAAKMSQNKLMLWDVLAIIKQGFVHAFLANSDKETLLKQCDAEIYTLLIEQAHTL